MKKTIDIKVLPNPYNFSHPVTNRLLFSGRGQEIKDICYYLDQSRLISHPYNLAILGSRAAGKTSLLNMVEIEAKKRQICVARIDLNEGDVIDITHFFIKLFYAVFSAACDITETEIDGREVKFFGGLQGRQYTTYLDMLTLYEVPEDRTLCDFQLPVFFAKAMSRGNTSPHLVDSIVRSDFSLIHRTVKRPIAILLDECDVLSKDRHILQGLRNMFMNMPGYMLVLTGTENFIPVMGDVFSHFAREFKKIEVLPFSKKEDAEECIKKPLQAIGLNPDRYLSKQTLDELTSIHDIAGGRPYEIQLLCHQMFRQMQIGDSPTMRLSQSILDSTLEEMGHLQGLRERPVLSKLRHMDEETLHALCTISAYGPTIAIDRAYSIDQVIRVKRNWDKSRLSSKADELVSLGVLVKDNDEYSLCIDDFERIYAKYYTRQRGVSYPFAFSGRKPEYILRYSLCSIADKASDDKLFRASWDPFDGELGETHRSDVVRILNQESVVEIIGIPMPLSEHVYFHFANKVDAPALAVISATVSFPWNKTKFFFVVSDEKRSNIVNWIPQVAERIGRVGGSIEHSVSKLVALDRGELVDALYRSENSVMKEIASGFHMRRMVEVYVKERNIIEAVYHGESSALLDSDAIGTIGNNLGYLKLASGDYQGAIVLLKDALKTIEIENSLITLFNISVCLLMLEDRMEALKFCIAVLDIAKDKEIASHPSEALHIPQMGDGKAILVEEFEVNVVEAASNLKKLLDSIAVG